MQDGAKPHVNLKSEAMDGFGKCRRSRSKADFRVEWMPQLSRGKQKEAAAELANKEGGLRMRREEGSMQRRAPETHLQLETQLLGYTTIRSSRICRAV